MNASRREFLGLGAMAGAAVAFRPLWAEEPGKPLDPDLCAVVADNHSWQDNIIYSSYGRKTMVRMLGLPSMGMDRDVGYALVQAHDDRLELTQVERDYYFPVMTPKEDRLPIWDCAVRERNGRRLSFPFDKRI